MAAAENHPSTKAAFDAGVSTWLPIFGDITFITESLPLSRNDCVSFSEFFSAGASQARLGIRDALASRIDVRLAELGWEKVFVKLSTRSPKDAPQIFEKAVAQFQAQVGPDENDHNKRCRLLFDLVQQNYSVASGTEALELLTSSKRVREDIEEVLKVDGFESLDFGIQLRRWDRPLPIHSEFRSIAWKGQMNAIWQYYHAFHFPELEAQRESIAADLLDVYNERRARLGDVGLESCVLDFAWLGPREEVGADNVRVIEVNPFDGEMLGVNDASMGLFKWGDEADKRVITEGPFELRLRSCPMPLAEMKFQLNDEFRRIVFPTWEDRQAAKRASGAAKGKGKDVSAALTGAPSSKGKGKAKVPAA